MSQPPAGPHHPAGALAGALATLAGTPDDNVGIDAQLVLIVRLAADLVEPVSYASVTAEGAGPPTTVAASSQLALDVDAAQYADSSGPCLDALRDAKAVEVPDIGAVMAWPQFRDVAWNLGLRASLSIPLFAGSGVPVAALNLYAHDPEPMTELTRHVRALYDGEPGDHGHETRPGCAQLLAGIATALHTRDLIQQAIGVVMARDHVAADTAYLTLRVRAAEIGKSLPDVAVEVTRPPA
ncbi:GAF and ANTAR domain-containing protein [Asanoa sp. NPDC049573]|uniref:GAF and ANTAR domain-containing protein n=1 Tax=Asanoa sp. NPDC049573 TaxID=3155396 RepID=UPI00341AC29C